jgi:hypothetical protein
MEYYEYPIGPLKLKVIMLDFPNLFNSGSTMVQTMHTTSVIHCTVSC